MTDTLPAQPKTDSADRRRKQLGHGPFDQVPAHWKPGLLLSSTWQAPFTHGLTDVWRERCEGYWERIEQRFGVVLTDHRNAWDEVPEVGPCVVTFAAILFILPDVERTAPRPKMLQ